VNLAFIHIPKNAGNSVRQALNLRNLAITEQWNYPFVETGNVSFGHTPLKKALELMADDFKRTSFKFAFSRNPFDRAVSMHAFLGKRDKPFEMTPESFLNFTEWLCASHETNLVTHAQTTWLEGGKLNYVGKVEAINECLQAIADAVGLTITEVPKANTGRHGPYQGYYCQKAIDNIVKIYRCDFDKFGYNKKLQ